MNKIAQVSGDGSWIAPETLSAFQSASTTAHRIYNQPGCWIERFGRDFLISHTTPAQRDETWPQLRDWCAAQSLPIDRLYSKTLADTEEARLAPKLIHGDAALPPHTVVTENGLRYGLDFAASYSAGLFIDQRANRELWRKWPPKRLLNCFAYTCSFSVTAAKRGAETVSVDLSKKSLDRGRSNFGLNQIETPPSVNGQPLKHRFIADDVFGVLPYLKKRGETFDGIVLDPPTFARGTKAKTFRVERDFGTLFEIALDLATPNARILLSTNCTRLQHRDLESIARAILKQRHLRATLTPGPSLPDIPDEGMPSTVWVTLG